MLDHSAAAIPGEILQVAYTVPDVEQAALAYAQRLRIGPWFVRGPLQSAKSRYRGAPTDLSVTIALSYSGPLMLELIQQNNDAPSVYRDTIDARGHGFHHWGIACERFDDAVANYQRNG
jgi:hypothetical protein